MLQLFLYKRIDLHTLQQAVAAATVHAAVMGSTSVFELHFSFIGASHCSGRAD